MSKEQSPKKGLLRYPIAAAAGGLALLLVGAIAYRFSALDEATAELDAKRTEAQTAERNVRNAGGLEQQLEVLVANSTRLEEALIGVDDVSANQAYFYRLETGTGVRLIVLRPTGIPNGSPKDASFAPAGFSVVVQGNYSQVVAFLRALEHGERLYRLIDFKLQRATDQGTGVGPQIALVLNLQLLAKKP